MAEAPKLDQLNTSVTTAILAVEALPQRAPELSGAWFLVSQLEEQIADHPEADDLEREVAMLGTVAAAMKASDPTRARELARRYLDRGLSDQLRRHILGELGELG